MWTDRQAGEHTGGQTGRQAGRWMVCLCSGAGEVMVASMLLMCVVFAGCLVCRGCGWSPDSTLKTCRTLNKILVSPKPNRRSVQNDVCAHTPTSWWSDQIKTATQSFQWNAPVGILCVYFGNNPSKWFSSAAVESHSSTVWGRAGPGLHILRFVLYLVCEHSCQVD